MPKINKIKEQNQTPTYEEFMKIYNESENLNYDDLNTNTKSYGPGGPGGDENWWYGKSREFISTLKQCDSCSRTITGEEYSRNGGYCSSHGKRCRYWGCGTEISGGEYCSSHSNRCATCGGREWVEYGYCRDHRCGECSIPVDSGGYCSNHAKHCPCCSKRISEYNERCNECAQKYKCQYSYCSVITYPSEWSYCINHKAECHYNNIKPISDKRCEKRVRNEGEKCEDHQKNCEFRGCGRWVSNYTNHCSEHPPQVQARLYREENERLRRQLEEMRRGQNEYQFHTEPPHRSSRNN